MQTSLGSPWRCAGRREARRARTRADARAPNLWRRALRTPPPTPSGPAPRRRFARRTKARARAVLSPRLATDGAPPGDRLTAPQERAGPLCAAATATDPTQLRKGEASAGPHRVQHLDRTSAAARTGKLARLARLARPSHPINLAARRSAPLPPPRGRAINPSSRPPRREKTLSLSRAAQPPARATSPRARRGGSSPRPRGGPSRTPWRDR